MKICLQNLIFCKILRGWSDVVRKSWKIREKSGALRYVRVAVGRFNGACRASGPAAPACSPFVIFPKDVNTNESVSSPLRGWSEATNCARRWRRSSGARWWRRNARAQGRLVLELLWPWTHGRRGCARTSRTGTTLRSGIVALGTSNVGLVLVRGARPTRRRRRQTSFYPVTFTLSLFFLQSLAFPPLCTTILKPDLKQINIHNVQY